jgi:hypothetical protein
MRFFHPDELSSVGQRIAPGVPGLATSCCMVIVPSLVAIASRISLVTLHDNGVCGQFCLFHLALGLLFFLLISCNFPRSFVQFGFPLCWHEF